MDADTATWLREARHARGLDVRTLAWSAGVAPAAVEAVEAGTATERFGRSLAAAWTWAIARALGLDAEPRLAALDGREQRLADPEEGEPAVPGLGEATGDAAREAPSDPPADADEPTAPPSGEDRDLAEPQADDAPDAPPGGWDESTLWLWAPPDDAPEAPDAPDTPDTPEAPEAPEASQGAAPPDDAEPPERADPLVPPEPVDAGAATEDATKEEPTQRLLTPPLAAGQDAQASPEEPTTPLPLGDEDHDAPVDGLDEPFEEERSRWRSLATFVAGFAVLVVAGLGVGALIAQLFEPGESGADPVEELAEGPLEDEEDAADDAAPDDPDGEQGEDGEDGEEASQAGLGERALGGDPEAAPEPEDTTVQVLDGSEQDHAQDVIVVLEEHGYQVIDSGPAAAAWDETRVLVTSEAEDAAAGLLEREPRLPDAEPNEGELDEGVDLHLIVGADWPER